MRGLACGEARHRTGMADAWVGQARTRVDGKLKVTGAAQYAGDIRLPGTVFAALVQAPVAHARIVSIHTEQAKSMPGVLEVFTNATFVPGLKPIEPPPAQFTENFPAERRAPLSDNIVHYAGQHVALIVAASLEQAKEAAAFVRVEYEPLSPELTLRVGLPGAYAPDHFATNSEEKLTSARGVKPAKPHTLVAESYNTPVVHHNPMEPSATVAVWEGDELTVYDSTRWVKGSQRILAHMLCLPEEKVHVRVPLLGGAFGSKGFLWQHVALCAQAARALGRPVKLVLTRAEMFTSTGHRPETRQQVVLSAETTGALLGAEHHTLSGTSPVAHFVEPCGMTTRNLYATPYASISHRVAPLNRATPCFMRAPGEAPGMFALEVAMDELAEKLDMDPLALRLRNDASRDLEENRPYGRSWSGRHLRECYERGAELFGWGKRPAQPRSMNHDGKLVGWGMATAAYLARRSPATVRGMLGSDGVATFSAATHEIGGGTATVMQQVAADALGWPIDRVRFELGDSGFPEAPVAGASQTTASVGPAVEATARALHKALVGAAITDRASSFFGAMPESVTMENGLLRSGERQEPATAVLSRLTGGELVREAHAEIDPEVKKQYTFHSFGVHFAEVTWEPAVAELRVTRWVSVMDCGRVLNHKTARSQIEGGVLFGLGMALMEEIHYDPRTGAPVNNNFAEYHLPTCADTPEFMVEFVEHPDLLFNPIGSRGLGELGITGAPAALANAVYHATGTRIRRLPLTPDRIQAGET
jgi:xanthine dehydrogenase YagR molybdenum-binding subunit